MNQIKVLENDEIQIVHNNTLDLLEKVGVKIESDEAKNLLKKNGAIAEKDNDFVKFPESLIKEQLKKVPDSFKLWGTDGSFSFEVDTKNTQFATVGTPIKIYDPSSKKGIRKTVLEDTIKQIRIVDSLKNIMCSHVDVWPNDVPYLETHYHAIKAWAENSYKPYGLGCYGRVASEDMMHLTSLIAGGEDELKTKPRLIGFFNPTSPLMLTKILLNGLFVFAKYNQPTIIAPAASAGATAP
ncbi:MAG: trimethylamine methyltransferase family protein, partial [Candidatus Thorarchaeota archaeon]